MPRKTFEYEGTSIEFTVSGDTNNRNRNFIDELIFKTPAFTFSIFCGDRESVSNQFIRGHGSSSDVKYGPCKQDSSRYKFKGNGKSFKFRFTIPMEVAINMHKLIEEAEADIDELNRTEVMWG